MTTTESPDPSVGVTRATDPRRPSPSLVGLLAILTLVVAAMLIPAITGWDVHVGFPPLFASWGPRIGPGSVVAIPLAGLAVAYGDHLAQTLPWRRLLAAAWLSGLVWLASLLLVDVHRGAQSYADVNDLMQTARSTTNVSQTLHEYIGRIPQTGVHWPTHVAGHPAGALLFFVVLVRLGLGDNIVAGGVIVLLASTIPLAVLTTLRALRADSAARLAAPFLTLGPAALWEAVSFDAVLTCISVWGLAAFAVGAAHRRPELCLVAGLLFGIGLEMSYGLPLLAIVVAAVCLTLRSYRSLWPVAIGVGLVVGVMAWAGFALWDAYPAVHGRYLQGIGGVRPASYWIWGDLAALSFSAGPVLGPAVAQSVALARRRLRPRKCRLSSEPSDGCRRAVIIVGGAALLAVVLADLSLMSKAEVERIWLPFVPWLLVLCALLPAGWRRPALALQVLTALLVQHLLITAW